MIRFNNDYNHGAFPGILEAFEKTNDEACAGYGLDEWCEKGAKEIKRYLGPAEADIHYFVGGTQVNFTVIAAALRPYQAVVCADSGHINVHETGAVENTGHKILAQKGVNGKLTAADIAAEAENFRTSGIREHIVQPKLVYLSFPTEYGTLYTKAELEEIRAVCNEYAMYLYVDGARMGYGLAAEDNDVTLADLARVCDAFYIGGTKCGAMFGEAAVIIDPQLKVDFRSYIKQNGAMLAKGWLLGLQFYTLFHEGAYFDITRKAVGYAMRLKAAFAAKGIQFFVESSTNQQFVILTDEQMKKLAENYVFEYEAKLPEGRHCLRFCTSWSTTENEVEALVCDIAAL